MRIIADPQQANLESDTVLTIGAFDGLHLGHQGLLKRLMARARQTQRLSGVVTFDPLPREVLDPKSNTICLSGIEDKALLLEQWGLDVLVVLRFDLELARTSAQDFVQMLHTHLRMRELWIGWDFALGHKRVGNATALKKLGTALGFQLHVIRPVRDGQAVISSTQIRSLIGAGLVREAAEMLGRYHQMRATVVAGQGRGRQLGYSTANLQPARHCAVPADGTYAAYVVYGGQRYLALAHIGQRPTFGPGRRVVEAHLLGFDGDLYGQEVLIQFVDRLREERRFANEDALRAQIKKDIARAREILE
jgi:riboflavin kinase/FMN adenylyltransferase